VVRDNDVLAHFDIGFSAINSEGTIMIVRALDTNCTLFTMEYAPHSYHDAEKVAEAVARIDDRRIIIPMMDEIASQGLLH